MNTANLGVRVYGLAAIALGLIGLVWADFDTVWQPVQALPFILPHRTALACAVALCLLLAGLAIQWRPTAQAASAVLAVIYFLFALLWLPRVLGFPKILGTWSGFAEQLILVAAAAIVYASLAPRGAAWTTRTARIASLLFGVCAIAFGLAHFSALPQTAAMVPKWLPPSQQFWAAVTGAAHLLAGLAILSGVLAVLALRLLTAMILSFGALVWMPLLLAAPHGHTVWAGNAITLAIAGAAWVVADWEISRKNKP